tara:strand:- start:1333 stop:1773 length:441 start_codon:yes stop_codon:yes gene_type:complete
LSKYLLLLVSFTCLAIQGNESPDTVWAYSPKQFDCSPNEISVNGSVSILFGENSFKELAIYREPDSTWLFLVVDSAPKGMKSLMSTSQLKATSLVSLTSETMGFRWEANGYNEIIFTVPGKYTLYNSDNLESEMGGYKCDIVITRS